MREKLNGIIIGVTKYNDRFDVVSLYSRSRGRLSFLSPVGSGKSGNARRSRLLLLSVIETEAIIKPTAELHKLGSFTLKTVWNDIYFHPVKRLMAIFISEFLNRLLIASSPDQSLWDFIYESLSLLDKMDKGLENYHIAFLVSLLSFSGIQPDVSDYREGMIFDMRAGSFSDSVPLHSDYLSGEEARMAYLLSRINFANARVFKLSGNQRFRLLNMLLLYYSQHFPGINNMKSLNVIHDLFH